MYLGAKFDRLIRVIPCTRTQRVEFVYPRNSMYLGAKFDVLIRVIGVPPRRFDVLAHKELNSFIRVIRCT
jgi:hypothetical protein